MQALARIGTRAAADRLAGIADDDIAVHLGRSAEGHPALAETVATALEDIETELSPRIARRIRGAD